MSRTDNGINDARMASLLWHDASASDKRASCLSDVDVAVVVDALTDAAGSGPELEAEVLEHIASCVRCRSAVSGVAATLGAELVTDALDQLALADADSSARRFPGRIRRHRRATAIAAAIVLVVAGGLVTQRGSESDATHRSTERGFEFTPVPAAPIGPVRSIAEFSWAPVAGADMYRVTVYASDGSVLWERRTAETTEGMPQALELPEGVPLFWQVSARVGFDTWVGSPLTEFQVQSGP